MSAVRLSALLVILMTVHLPGSTLEIRPQGDRYYFHAEDVPLIEVLEALNTREGGRLVFFDAPDRKINCRYQSIEIDGLLGRLRVSYTWQLGKETRVEGGEAGWYGPGKVLSAEQRAAALAHILNLRDDDIPFNAINSTGDLLSQACDIIPLLEQAMLSDDAQQKYAAAAVVRHGCPSYVPSDRMLELTLGMLNAHNYDWEWNYLFWPGEPYEWLRDATNHFYRFKHRLVENLSSDEPNERVRSAMLLAEYGQTEYTDRLAKMLVPHLKDNRIPRDGCLAAYALYRLGPGTRPYLEPLLKSGDEQAASFAELVLYQFDHPGDTNGVLRHFWSNTYNRNPVINRPYMKWNRFWDADRFPDSEGNYPQPPQPPIMPPKNHGQPPVNQPLEVVPLPPLSAVLPQLPYELRAKMQGEELPMEYTVLTGDTWEEIAKLFIVKEDELRSVNPHVGGRPVPPAGTTIYIQPPEL